MTITTTSIDIPGDAELISAVRGGDLDAYGDLFERHVEAARRLARQLVSPGDVEDLVSEAFVKVLGIIQRGGGPEVAFRAYLLTSVRSLRVDKFRAGARLHTTDDMEAFDPGVPFRDTAIEGFESTAAARAFASLPERWQLVLWHTEVEGERPADIAPLLGMSANSVSALAYRAREGLRQAYLVEHAGELDEDTCRWTHQHLGAYIRNGTSRRDAAKVEGHLTECRSCMAVYLELTEVNSNLGALLAPLLLGGAATAYVGTAGGVGLPVGIGLAIGRVRDLVAANSATVAVAGVAASVTLVGGALVIGLNTADQGVEPSAIASGLPGAAATDGSTSSTLSGRSGTSSPGVVEVAPGDTVVVDVPVSDVPTVPVEIPTGSSTTSPTSSPTPGTTDPGTTDDTGPTTDPSPTSTATPSPTGNPSPTSTPSPSSTQSPSQATSPSSSPSAQPAAQGTTQPNAQPNAQPSAQPTSQPTSQPTQTPPPPPPAGTDVSVGGQFIDGRPNYRLRFEVAGLPAGTEGTLVISTTGAVVLQKTDARCSVTDDVATCAVSGPTSVEIVAVAPLGGTIQAEIRVGDSDPDLGNNTWRALLD